MPVVETHQLRNRGIVRSRPKRATEGRAIEQHLQAADHSKGGEELQERQNSDPNGFAQGEARHLDRAGVEPAAVRGEQLEQPVLNDDGEAEGDQERRQEIIAEGAIEEQALQRVADRRHDQVPR